jgi:hypothetical protein
MTSPQCTVNATATTNGVDLTPATTATIALANVAGVNQWSILAVNTDELNLAATVNASLTVDSITKTATFTVPAAGSAVVFESKVNNGRDINGRINPAYTTRFAIYTLTGTGFRVCAFDETLEGNASFGWITKLNGLIRSASVAPASAGAGLTYTLGVYDIVAADATMTINADSIQVKTGDGLIANANGVSIAAADATIQVGANAIQVVCGDGLVANGSGVSVAAGDGSIAVGANSITVGVISDGQHGSRGNGSLHTVATGSLAGFMPAAHFTLVNGATAAATAGTLGLRDGSGGIAFGVVTGSEFTTGSNASGFFRSANNAAAAGASTQVFLKSGDQTNAGVSGVVRVESGAAPSLTGNVTLASGASSGSISGNVSITSGTGTSTGGTSVSSGAAATGTSGSVTLSTGAAPSTTGAINLTTGSSSGTGRGGSITLTTGGSASGSNRGGDIALVTGVGAAGAGNIALGTVPANYGNGLRVTAIALSTAKPTAAVAGYYILFTDPSDLNKLKVIGPSGTVTTLASP